MVAWHDGDRTTAADTSQRVDTCGGSRNDRPVPFVRRRACALAQHLGPILQGSQATLCRMLSNLLARAKVIQVIHGWPPHRVSNRRKLASYFHLSWTRTPYIIGTHRPFFACSCGVGMESCLFAWRYSFAE